MSEPNSVLDAICQWERETALLESTQATLEWDERTGMPSQAGPYRAEQITYLSGLIHQRRTDAAQSDRIETLVQIASSEPEHSDLAVTARYLKRNLVRRQKLPLDLVQATTKAIVLGQQAWSQARKTRNFEHFLPNLQTIVQLKQEEAQLLAINGSAYNGLLDEYEEGASEAHLTTLFADLRQQLVPIVAEASEATRRRGIIFRQPSLPISSQRSFNRLVAEQVGFNFESGRLDETDHPFCTTLGPRDCRILTRYFEQDLLSSMFSTLHEAGHGMYEQGLPAEQFGLPLGSYASLGIHESQSRLWENAVGRSLSFWKWCWPLLQQHFPGCFEQGDAETVYRFTNAVAPSLIRVESDEATYNLHIAIRFGLERELISGTLSPADLPDAWNKAYRDYLGITPSHHAEGCLQDVHWSAGLFGYFPTYTLGNLIAAQWMETIEQSVGDLSERHSQGDFRELLHWLRSNIHRHGKRYAPKLLVEMVTGSSLTATPFLTYLKRKLRDTALLSP
jgi:carboxypeptidase Taq